ncbi:testis-expressed protein 36 isoform X5 [Canis lupus dingo]|uniref:testis-expressed protein 36 isoform X5 n=1 Tax=Canis lupus dingo TaxID=286419 RepID=UPI0020C316DF|nr:testis-expressed protein 36 isoform X5 [Canis lupus dingo]
MAKGRRFNPALDKDGRWRVLVFQFPQIGLTQKTPESSTSAVLKEPHRPHLSRQVEERLPPIYKVREKQAVNNNFPFSVHDNRHSFQSSGCYLDSVTLMAHKVGFWFGIGFLVGKIGEFFAIYMQTCTYKCVS